MNVNQANALVVAKMFAALADARFSMRTLPAIRKAAADEAMTDAVIANLAADFGLRVRRRIRDNAMLIERPVSADEALAISAKAQLVLAGTEQPFDLDFTPAQPAVDLAAESDVLAGEQGNAEGSDADGE